MELHVDPERLKNFSETGILVRAKAPDGTYDAFDIAHLTSESLLVWLRSRGGMNPYAENVVGTLLGYGPITNDTIPAKKADGLFIAIRNEAGSSVWFDGKLLDPRVDLMHHSEGFSWGYEGSGPAQLALAMLAKATGDDALAVMTHQLFKADVIASLNKHSWTMTTSYVNGWVDAREDQL